MWSPKLSIAALVGGILAFTLAAAPADGPSWVKRVRWATLFLAAAAVSPFAASALHLTGARSWDYLRCPD